MRINPNVITFIVYGLLYDTVINMWKPFSAKFLQRLGGTAAEISLLSSLPGIVAALVLFPAAMLIAKLKNKKRVTAAFFFMSRIMLFFVALIPMVPEQFRPALFLIVISVMNLPDAISQTSLQSYLGDIFEGNVRASAIGLRLKFSNVFIPLVTLLTGAALSFFPKTPGEVINTYQVFFIGAFIIGIAEIAVFTRFREIRRDDMGAPGASAAHPSPSLKIIKSIFRDKKFVRFLVSTLIFYFFWHSCWSICTIYQVQYLKANEMWLAVFALASGIGTFFSAGFWNKLIYKRGNAFCLSVSACLMGVSILLYVVSRSVYPMLFVCVFSGFAQMGLNVSLLNGLLQNTPSDNKIVYIGVYNTFINMSLFVAPLVSFFVLSAVGIYITLAIYGTLRICGGGILYLEHLREKREKNS